MVDLLVMVAQAVAEHLVVVQQNLEVLVLQHKAIMVDLVVMKQAEMLVAVAEAELAQQVEMHLAVVLLEMEVLELHVLLLAHL
jgi:hypothetical protein